MAGRLTAGAGCRGRSVDALAAVDSANGAGRVVVLCAGAIALGVKLPQGRDADGARESRAVVEALEGAAVQHLRRSGGGVQRCQGGQLLSLMWQPVALRRGMRVIKLLLRFNIIGDVPSNVVCDFLCVKSLGYGREQEKVRRGHRTVCRAAASDGEGK